MASEPDSARMTKADFEAAAEPLRADLLEAQFALRDAAATRGPLVLLLAGDDRPGCNASFDLLREWLDPRFLSNEVLGKRTDEERQRPPFWRYWRALPPAGRMAVFFGGWTRELLAEHLRGALSEAELARRVGHVRSFEGQLIAAGAALVKFWLHLPGAELRRRRRAARSGDFDDGLYRKRDARVQRAYAAARDMVVRVLHETSLAEAPWQVLDASDPRRRDLAIGRALLVALRGHATAASGAARSAGALPAGPGDAPHAGPDASAAAAGDGERPGGVLAAVDLSRRVDPRRYDEELERRQARITRLTGRAARRGVSTVLVFEGWDAAGKGGVVRRMTAAIDAANYRVHPIAAPSAEERRYPYLWRFWRVLPRAGQVCIFDRSWYGRVLVERVEGFARPDEWERAYDEINDFEAQLVEHGVRVAKFWLHVSAEVQLRRFEERQQTPHKQFKIGPEDWRNREKRAAYEAAVEEMVTRTDRPGAAWHLIPADDKYYARLRVLRIVARLLGEPGRGRH